MHEVRLVGRLCPQAAFLFLNFSLRRCLFSDQSKDEYEALKELENEFSGYGDWDHGETLILDSHFEDYAIELAEETCCIENSNQWPFSCIDWEKAADELKHDYVSADAGGYTYWMRA